MHLIDASRKAARWWAKARRLGIATTIKYVTVGAIYRRVLPRGRFFAVRPRGVAHPIRLRSASSDFEVFEQIFIHDHLAHVHPGPIDGLIVDCGANIGCSAAYFLARFPACRVVAVEPDPANYALLAKNLAPYGDRVIARNEALWSHVTRVRMRSAPYLDGREWTRQTDEAAADAGTIRAVDVGTLLDEVCEPRAALIKIDIEGAEAVVFRAPAASWIDRVDCLAVELHDDTHFGSASEAFAATIAGRGLIVRSEGELTVACRAPATSQHTRS